jgi:hypothetical protein
LNRPLHAALKPQGINTVTGDQAYDNLKTLEVRNKKLQAVKNFLVKELALKGLVIYEVENENSLLKCFSLVMHGN